MSTVIDDFSPISVGDTLTPFAPVFQQKVNGVLVARSLAGATLSTRMENQYGIIKVWNSANWTIDDAVNGLAHYQYQASDVDTAGTWTMQTQIMIGGLPVHTDTKTLVILPSI
jgi:hypothetical protein